MSDNVQQKDEFAAKWQRELEIFRKIKSCIIFEGNIFDKFTYPGDEKDPQKRIGSLTQYLYYYLKYIGYSAIAFYDVIHGFSNPFDSVANTTFFENFRRVSGIGGCGSAAFTGNEEDAPAAIERAMTQKDLNAADKRPTAIILDFASRYISDPTNLVQDEVNGYTVLLQAALRAVETKAETGEILKNICILIVNKLNDLPPWFYLDNPVVKPIVIQKPTLEEKREMLSGDKLKNFFSNEAWEAGRAHYESHPGELDKLCRRFVSLTEGFTYSEILGLKKLCRNQNIAMRDMCSVIDLYKFGIIENPWNKEDLKDSLRGCEADFRKRVKGQDVALTQVLDVVKRAVTGMADITSTAHGKPKGVLFFAGPTGTGKTETAKALAEKIFGDESACIRFDMSEFGESHSDQRLLGAPPGYVGYESGGQLTNAVKTNPFSILLFDEIEKAHPSILDKFLQILEDGRMTDGKGETVYFSECIIIFTSNLGIYEDEVLPDGSRRKKLIVNMDMEYDELRRTVRTSVEKYFKEKLGRPEILNRIGDNIVVYDFISPDVAEEILTSKLEKIAENLKERKNISLEISPTVWDQILMHAKANLENGGRGIGNVVESLFVNPLSRFLFDADIEGNCKVVVNRINDECMPYSADCVAG